MHDFPWKRTFALLVLVGLLLVGVRALVRSGDDNAPSAAPTPAPATVNPPSGSDLASDLRAESGISAEDKATNRRIGRRLPNPQQTLRSIAPPCVTDYSGTVYSDRAPGVRPSEFVLHYTVSRNTLGWSDVRGIQNYFKRTRVGSAHFIVDFEGHCLKMVPGDKKAWTQGNANSYAYSVEIVAYGDEPASAWKSSPLIKDMILARLVRSVMDAHGLPLRRVDPVGCVFPAGWTDHNHLECGNDHHDVSPHFPFKLFARQLREVR